MPEDIYEQIALHYPLSFEDLQLPVATANPLSLAIHAIHWILLAPLFKVREEPESVLRSSPIRKGVGGRWDRFEEAPSVLKRGLGGGWTVSCPESCHRTVADAVDPYHHCDSHPAG